MDLVFYPFYYIMLCLRSVKEELSSLCSFKIHFDHFFYFSSFQLLFINSISTINKSPSDKIYFYPYSLRTLLVKKYLKFFYLLIVILFAIPSFKLISYYIKSDSESYILEIDDSRNLITRYIYKKGDGLPFTNLHENRQLLNSKQIDYIELDDYYKELYRNYHEDNLEIDTHRKNIQITRKNVETYPIREGIAQLDKKNVHILGEGKKFKIFHYFDGSTDSNVFTADAEKTAQKLDERYEEIDFFVNNKNVKSFFRDPNIFKVVSPKKI